MIPVPSSAAGSSTGVTLTVVGFPTRIRPTFVILIAVVGWYPDITVARLVIWVAVASVAVTWHELGHAMAARRLGASPTIDLYGFGGATTWQPASVPTRAQLIGVSFAGPLAGFGVGAVVAGGVALAGGLGSGDVRYFVLVALWTNVGWGLVNLLPVLPLDGGHILAELLPGDRATRNRRAAAASVAVAGLAMVVLLITGVFFGALLLGWIVWSNLSMLRSDRAERNRDAIEDQTRDALVRFGAGDTGAMAEIQDLLADLRPHSARFRAVAIETAAATGSAADARTLLDSSPDDEPLAPGLDALVDAAESAGRDGTEELAEIFRREPLGRHARWLAIALRWGDRLEELAPIMASAHVRVDTSAFAEAAAVAEGLGSPTAARDVRDLGETVSEG